MLLKTVCATLLCVFTLVAATTAEAAVGLTSCTYFEGAGCTNCDTTVHTVGASDNYLLVFVGQDTDVAESNLTGATWDFGGSAQAMTPIGNNNGVGVVAGKAFELVNPTVGNLTLRATATSGTRCCDIHICSFTGVNTSDPSDTPVEEESGGGSTTGSSLAFTLNGGGLAVAFVISQTSYTNFAHGADQTERLNLTAGCNSDCQSITTSATVSPLNYTWNASSTSFWHVVIPINAASSSRRPVMPLVFQ